MTQAQTGEAAGVPKSSRPKGRANVYTVMTFFALVCLGATIGYILFRSKELFGSVGELFNLPQAAGWFTSLL